MKINVLPKEISELIAAGEVIDRPSAVVKELVENSIDAKATRIEIDIEVGGIKLIRVIDNGIGFDKEDLEKAFIRHATSKIENKEDLNKIYTLGFRGEALPSIAAVCKVKLESNGYCYEVGKKVNECTYQKGACFEARDIYYNTPARLKFLKKDIVEGASIKSLIERFALANPKIAFKLKSDGKAIFFTPGDGELLSVIRIIYGSEVANNLLKVEYKEEDISVKGYIGKPSFSRASRAMQLFFVNSRLIRSTTCTSALEDAYRHYIMIGKFPVAILDVCINSSNIDVNVHPAKLEVRFSSEIVVYNCIKNAVEGVLHEYDNVSTKTSDKLNIFTLSAFDHTDKQVKFDTIPSIPIKNVIKEIPKFETKPLVFDEPEVEVKKEKKETTVNEVDYVVLGEVFDTYILVQQGDLFHIIDKHAAHERKNYNNILEAVNNQKERQVLLNPIICNLTTDEYSIIISNLDSLTKFGIYADDYGDNQIVIRELPLLLLNSDIESIVSDIANKLLSNHGVINANAIDEILYSMSCRSSIMGGNKNSRQEIEKIVSFVLGKDKIRYCPHGRPAIITLNKNDFEKMFGRLG